MKLVDFQAQLPTGEFNNRDVTSDLYVTKYDTGIGLKYVIS